MRPSMMPELRAAAHNQRHQRAHGALFEFGRTYAPAPDAQAEEREFLAALVFGAPSPDHWRATWRASTCTRVGLARPCCSRQGSPRRRSQPGTVFSSGAAIRWSPRPHRRWAGRSGRWCCASWTCQGRPPSSSSISTRSGRAPSGVPQFEDLLTYPASTRDLAFVVGDDIAASTLVATARQAGGALVRDARVFDRYAGEQIGAHG